MGEQAGERKRKVGTNGKEGVVAEKYSKFGGSSFASKWAPQCFDALEDTAVK